MSYTDGYISVLEPVLQDPSIKLFWFASLERD